MKLGKLLMIVSNNTFIRLYDMHNNFICGSYNQVGTLMDYIDETVVEITIDDIDPTMSAAKLGSLLKTKCGEILASNPQNYTHYRINLRGNYSEDDFTSLVLLTSMYFFSCLLDEGGRARERRLGIPAALSEVCISASSLKRAINTKTKVDIFNLTIASGDLVYHLI